MSSSGLIFVPNSVILLPFTVITPAVINSSAWRLEHIPDAAMNLLSLMESSPGAFGLLAALVFFFGPSLEKLPLLPSLEKLLLLPSLEKLPLLPSLEKLPLLPSLEKLRPFAEPLFGAGPDSSVLPSFATELFLFFPKELLSVRSLPPCLFLLNLPALIWSGFFQFPEY